MDLGAELFIALHFVDFTSDGFLGTLHKSHWIFLVTAILITSYLVAFVAVVSVHLGDVQT